MSASGDSRIEEKANKRAKAKQARGRRASAAGNVNWDGFDWWSFIALAEALCRNGGAVRLGKTRDQGAWALGIYLGDDYATEYIKPNEEFAEAVAEIVAAWVPAEADEWATRYAFLRG